MLSMYVSMDTYVETSPFGFLLDTKTLSQIPALLMDLRMPLSCSSIHVVTTQLFDELRTVRGVGLLPVAILQDSAALHSNPHSLPPSHVNRPRIATPHPSSPSHSTHGKQSNQSGFSKPDAHRDDEWPASSLAGWEVNGTTIRTSEHPGGLRFFSPIGGFGFR